MAREVPRTLVVACHERDDLCTYAGADEYWCVVRRGSAKYRGVLDKLAKGDNEMANVNKPTIPGEVADAIERLRSRYEADNSEIITLALKTGGGLHADTITLQKIPFDTLLAALVNGYGRELTEEEREARRIAEAHESIRDEYEEHVGHNGRYASGAEDDAFADGIRFALNALGVKISGVNA